MLVEWLHFITFHGLFYMYHITESDAWNFMNNENHIGFVFETLRIYMAVKHGSKKKKARQ